MKKHFPGLLHKMLPGTVHAQYNTCGKSNCKCSRGELHGAYYYHFTVVNGKLKKRYLKADEVQEIQAACLARQEQQKRAIQQNKEIWERIRTLREELRSMRNLYNF